MQLWHVQTGFLFQRIIRRAAVANIATKPDHRHRLGPAVVSRIGICTLADKAKAEIAEQAGCSTGSAAAPVLHGI